MNPEDVVKWPSKKKYPCKRNKGEHEWGEPKVVYGPCIDYTYEDNNVIITSNNLDKDKKLKKVMLRYYIEVNCIHCGKKSLVFLSGKI